MKTRIAGILVSVSLGETCRVRAPESRRPLIRGSEMVKSFDDLLRPVLKGKIAIER